MGQKANPNSLRYGVNKDWQSRWIAIDKKQFAKWLVEDHKIRELLIHKHRDAQVSNVEIERQQNKIELFIYSAQPGFLLGKEGQNLEKIKKEINRIVGRSVKVFAKVMTVENPQLSAVLVAREIADAIEKKVSFRNAQKQAIKKVLLSGAIGIKTRVSGRLGGVEMARVEGYSEGIIPLSTIRADIDYAIEEAHTTYGLIGVKVWINRGEIFGTSLRNINPILSKSKRSNSDFRRQANPNNKEA
ncbi:MAG: 30S ribosomal protein S3 [Mycoplasmoidaceae bacterium]